MRTAATATRSELRRAWGKLIAITDVNGNAITDSASPAFVNPIRYRGYYYDVETGFYYLNSRYYDPGVGRFLNADDLAFLGVSGTVLGYNLYGYCENDPVVNIDSNGKYVQAIVGAVINGLLSFLLYSLEYYLGMRKWNWWQMAGIVALNAAIGAVTWYLGLGGKFQKVLKLGGLAQKLGIKNVVVKGVKLLGSGISYLANMVIKSASRKPGETWFKAISRFAKKKLGFSL